jgi:hypothetical protein
VVLSHSGGGALIKGGTGGGVLQCWRRRERVRRTPFVSHDARRTGLLRRWGLDAGVARTSSGEAVRRPGDSVDRLGGELGGSDAWSRWRRKMGRKGGDVSGRWLFMVTWWHGWRGKRGQGSRVRRRVEGKTGKREGALGAAGDSLGGRHQSPDGGRWQRHCRVTGEGGGV